MDLLLSRHKGLLEPAEEIEYVNLLAEAREAPEDEEGNVPEIPLRLAILNKILELLVRDSSDEVNGFSIGGHTMWITPSERANYTLTIQAAKKAGVEAIPFAGVSLPVDTALAALEAIDLYAMQCVSVTSAHRANIEELGSLSDVARYDITVGYPAKLSF